jgi:MoxR-like ATPase
MPYIPDDLENETEKPSAPVDPAPQSRKLSDPSKYKPDKGLVAAIKVALMVGKPLLLTGRPGTGKTELGRYLAWKMGLPFELFPAKSTSGHRDPYYTYDAIRHFRAGGEARMFLTFNAMGIAIGRCARQTDELKAKLPEFVTDDPRQSVVVIDEIDKAPRDFPNDLLNEIDQKFFRIPEVGNVKVEADERKAPILVITSNSEKMLPAAFLRRCVYYDIEFPGEEALREIVSRRVDAFADPEGTLLRSVVARFYKVAGDGSGLKHQPGTAELIDWARALAAMGADTNKGLGEQQGLVEQTFVALVKRFEDRETARQILTRAD